MIACADENGEKQTETDRREQKREKAENTKGNGYFFGDFEWLPRRDSNPNKQNQKRIKKAEKKQNTHF